MYVKLKTNTVFSYYKAKRFWLIGLTQFLDREQDRMKKRIECWLLNVIRVRSTRHKRGLYILLLLNIRFVTVIGTYWFAYCLLNEISFMVRIPFIPQTQTQTQRQKHTLDNKLAQSLKIHILTTLRHGTHAHNAENNNKTLQISKYISGIGMNFMYLFSLLAYFDAGLWIHFDAFKKLGNIFG